MSNLTSMQRLFVILVVVAIVLFAIAIGESNRPSSTHSSFTNAYGTSSTKCAHPGCTSKIASSGDTNCCATHSNKCLNCGKYIDEDAMYCMSCLKKALQ